MLKTKNGIDTEHLQSYIVPTNRKTLKDPIRNKEMVVEETASKKKSFGFSFLGGGRKGRKSFDEKGKDATSQVDDTESRNDEIESEAVECQIDDEAMGDEAQDQEDAKNLRKSSMFFDNIGNKFLGAVTMGSKKVKENNENEQVLSDIVASVRE